MGYGCIASCKFVLNINPIFAMSQNISCYLDVADRAILWLYQKLWLQLVDQCSRKWT